MNLKENLHIEFLAFIEAFKAEQKEYKISFKFPEFHYSVMLQKAKENDRLF